MTSGYVPGINLDSIVTVFNILNTNTPNDVAIDFKTNMERLTRDFDRALATETKES